MFDISFFRVECTQTYLDNHYVPRKTQDTVAAAPCDSCYNSKDCASKQLACQHYAVWLDSRIPTSKHTRIPSKSIYNRLFGNK